MLSSNQNQGLRTNSQGGRIFFLALLVTYSKVCSQRVLICRELPPPCSVRLVQPAYRKEACGPPPLDKITLKDTGQNKGTGGSESLRTQL